MTQDTRIIRLIIQSSHSIRLSFGAKNTVRAWMLERSCKITPHHYMRAAGTGFILNYFHFIWSFWSSKMTTWRVRVYMCMCGYNADAIGRTRHFVFVGWIRPRSTELIIIGTALASLLMDSFHCWNTKRLPYLFAHTQLLSSTFTWITRQWNIL